MKIDVFISTAIVDGVFYPVLCMMFDAEMEWVRVETAQKTLMEMRSVGKGAGPGDKVSIICAGGEYVVTHIEHKALTSLIALTLKDYRKETKNE